MIYLDNAATTKMFESALQVYKDYACDKFFNPSAGYEVARNVAKDMEGVRAQIKAIISAKNGTIIFTGGATESNNLAILGSLRGGKCEYIFSQGEHPSVYNVAKELERLGQIVHFIPLTKNGEVDYDLLAQHLNDKTRLISIMLVSNETGAINDLNRVNELRKKYSPSALLHVDGVQAFCKFKVDVEKSSIDLFTISAHKFHGPKGVGALYVRDANKLKNIIFGGGQEGNYRSGTENVPGIMAMGKAIDCIDIEKNLHVVEKLNKIFKDTIKSLDKDNQISFVETQNPYIISVALKAVNGETLMRALQDNGVLVGKGSACSTKKSGNRILESMGIDKNIIKSHIRVSFDFLQDQKEIEDAAKIIYQTYRDIWERVK